jgi:hypothetical protein
MEQNAEEIAGAIKLGLVLITRAAAELISLFQMDCVRIVLMDVDNVFK